MFKAPKPSCVAFMGKCLEAEELCSFPLTTLTLSRPASPGEAAWAGDPEALGEPPRQHGGLSEAGAGLTCGLCLLGVTVLTVLPARLVLTHFAV